MQPEETPADTTVAPDPMDAGRFVPVVLGLIVAAVIVALLVL